MSSLDEATVQSALPRPLPATYWVVPGRLLAGEHPGSQSRADSMDRLRRLLAAGVTCFVDLTEPGELLSYEALLPFATPAGRRIEYLRESIPDHGVPAGRDVMARVVAVIDDALAAGHVVYVHCRAGIGRSATVVGCWLATHARDGEDALERLQALWQQSSRSRMWPVVPETEDQEHFIREWLSTAPRAMPAMTGAASGPAARIRGALLGLAVGDAYGASAHRKGRKRAVGAWTQHTALALCVAESLLECGRFDARDQIERYLRWRRDGHLAASGNAEEPTPDVARALATYQWRGLPMAGSHDPRDRSTSSLPRVVTAVAFALHDPAQAVALAAECSRTTHQSPVVLDACRLFGAQVCGALLGAGRDQVTSAAYEPVSGLWTARPLRAELLEGLRAPPLASSQHGKSAHAPDVVQALSCVLAAVRATDDVNGAVVGAVQHAREPALEGALAGALAGALLGPEAIPGEWLERLPRRELLEEFATRLGVRATRERAPA
jgi:ADP-ribosyl-[dinitrogen reductase] hydrolase